MSFRKAILLSLLFTMIITARVSAETPQAKNQIVILNDGTISYEKRQKEAIEQITKLLTEFSKIEMERWEEAEDEITIISIDAIPEVIWRGSLEELKATEKKHWEEVFKSRSDYKKCTDITGAFNLATQYLNGDPLYTSRYLFAFTDLKHDPPKSKISKCHPTNNAPSNNFPWKKFEGVRVNIYWVPPNQKLLWKREVEKQNLSNTFHLFSSESAIAPIKSPPRAEVALGVTEKEQEEQKEKIKNIGSTVFEWLKILALIVVALSIIIIIVTRLLRRRSPQTPQPPRQSGRPVPRPPHSRPIVRHPQPPSPNIPPHRNRSGSNGSTR